MKPRGRPTSPEAIEKVTENLKMQSSHGVFLWLRRGIPVPNCNQCIFSSECVYQRSGERCQLALEIYDEIFEEILKLGHISYTDRLLVGNFVKTYCSLIIIDKWVASVGPFQAGKEGLKAQSILDYKASQERLLLKYADALGIGPQARARLNLTNVQAFNFAEALQRAKPSAHVIVNEDESDE